MFRSFSLFACISLFLLSLAFNSTPVAAKGIKDDTFVGRSLSAKEINSTFYSKTVEADLVGEKDAVFIYFSPNGELKMVQKNRLYKGQWKSKRPDRLCTQLSGESRKCRIVTEINGVYRKYIAKKDGNHKLEMTFTAFHDGRQLKQLQKAPILPEGTLTKKKLKKLFGGKTVESMTAVKRRVSLTYYSPDGRVEQLQSGQNRSGKWRIRKDDRICLQMESAKEKCRIVVKEKNGYMKYIVKKNGNHQPTVKYRSFTSGKSF